MTRFGRRGTDCDGADTVRSDKRLLATQSHLRCRVFIGGGRLTDFGQPFSAVSIRCIIWSICCSLSKPMTKQLRQPRPST